MKLLLGAVTVSVGLHIVGASLGTSQQMPTIDGGEVSGEIALGLGFADLVAGVATGTARTPDTTAATTTTKLAAVTPPTATPPVTEKTMAPVVATSPVPKTIEPIQQRITAQAPHAEKVVEAPKGNAKVSTAKGQTSGTTSGRTAETSKVPAKTTATKVGARAVKTYHASIHRKISRVPKRSAGAKGDAFVGITIAGSGVISSVQIVKSSGHASIDNLALAQIKRAGPFAPTPNGAVMRVQVKFSSKS